METNNLNYYVTPGTPENYFDEKFHLHIDLARVSDIRWVFDNLIPFLERVGYYCAFNPVTRSIPGPQRKSIPWMYDNHDPRHGDDFGGFFSISFDDRFCLGALEHSIYDKLKGKNITAGNIEAEQPVAFFKEGVWKFEISEKEYMPKIEQGEFGFPVEPNMNFEIHHGFKFRKNGNDFPFTLEELHAFFQDNGVDTLGSAFILPVNGSYWCTTNSFTNDRSFAPQVEKENALLQRFIESKRLHGVVPETLVEWMLFVGKLDF